MSSLLHLMPSYTRPSAFTSALRHFHHIHTWFSLTLSAPFCFRSRAQQLLHPHPAWPLSSHSDSLGPPLWLGLQSAASVPLTLSCALDPPLQLHVYSATSLSVTLSCALALLLHPGLSSAASVRTAACAGGASSCLWWSSPSTPSAAPSPHFRKLRGPCSSAWARLPSSRWDTLACSCSRLWVRTLKPVDASEPAQHKHGRGAQSANT